VDVTLAQTDASLRTGRLLPAPRRASALVAALLALHAASPAQVPPERETASIKLGRLWVGVAANGASATFDYLAGFFPNDYDVLGNRGQNSEAYGGMGFLFATTDWRTPADTIRPVAVFGPTNSQYMPIGKVVAPLKSYIRYQFPEQVVDYKPVTLVYQGTQDPSKFDGHSYDQLLEVTTEHVFKIYVKRTIMAWTQSFNDDYVIVDVELTNFGTDTLKSFYVNMNEGNKNMQVSSIKTPYPAAGDLPVLPATWMHYEGGRVGDTMRVFYEYSADNPDQAGDNMGAPAVSQGGRLLYAQMTYCAILHASREPYDDPAADVDDFLQPRVTYIGNSTLLPNPPEGSDEYGDKNFWAIRGGFADYFPMDTVNAWPGTHHGGNNDDIGIADFSRYPSGSKGGTNDQRRWMSFGPYAFAPGKKLRIVYASGKTGLDLVTARQVGERWLAGTLENPAVIPDPEKGHLPAGFAFPPDATEQSKRKARWISTGIDSVRRSAWRARWNFLHNYNIPPAPPPPEKLTVTGHGDGVEISWTGTAAEARSDFAGWRIMRRLGNQDTAYYQEIYSSGPSDRAVTHLFKDSTSRVGAQYYYYVQSKARIPETDPSADPSTRGKIIYSSRLLVPDVTKINPKDIPQDDMSRIRVVPNPYNVNDPALQSTGWTDLRGLVFTNLPSTVTIRIFTENGDLVKEYYHNEPIKTGSWTWDMITRNQQVINSGLYIAVFEKPDGERSFQKFAVVR
jgi:hypothetical protein